MPPNRMTPTNRVQVIDINGRIIADAVVDVYTVAKIRDQFATGKGVVRLPRHTTRKAGFDPNADRDINRALIGEIRIS